MIILSIMLTGLVLGYVWMLILTAKEGEQRGRSKQLQWHQRWNAPFQYASFLWYRGAESSMYIQLARQAFVTLYGEKQSVERTRDFLYKLLLYVYVIALFGSLLALAAGGDIAIAVVCWSVAALVPVVMYKQLSAQVNVRRRMILSELPIVLNKIVLLLSAGETLQRSLLIAVGQRGETDHPLYAEFAVFLRHLDNRMSFAQGLEEFARRCAVHEVSLFSNAVLLNFKRGGDHLADALRSLSGQLWATRKALARTLGEEASSKLVVPMVIIFLVVMIIVATPALLYMN